MNHPWPFPGSEATVPMFPSARRLLSAFVLGFVLLSPGASANLCPPVDPAIQAAHQDFNDLQSAVRTAREGLDRARFDPASLQAELGRDPETLLVWVRDNTRWLDYEGSLRGPSGVLMDRMGSALDRSLLLAALLEAAGHPVQLASAPLDPGDLERLRSAWTGERDALEPLSAVPAAAIRDWTDAFGADAFGFAVDELARELEQRVEQWRAVREALAAQTLRQVAALDGALRSQTPPMDQDERQHWWVQVGDRQGWRDLDPALPELVPGQTLTGPATATLTIDEIDPDQFHRLTVQIVAEQWQDGRLREHIALEHQIRSAALFGRQLSIDLVPTALPDLGKLLDEVPSELPRMISEADEWLPVLHIGNDPVSTQRILADGSVRPVDRGPAQGRALRDATSALGGLSLEGRRSEAPAASPELAAVRVRFQLDAPGQERVVIRRELMDMIGPAARAQGRVDIDWGGTLRQQRAVAMLSGLQIQGQTGWLNEEFVAWQRYGALIDDRLAGLAALDAQAYERVELMGKALQSRSTLTEELLALAQLRHLLSPQQTRIALTGLNLLGWTRLVELEGQVPSTREGFDILHNPVEILSGSGNGMARSRLSQGVFETALEAWILDASGELTGGNTARRFQPDLDAGVDWVWLRAPADLAKLATALPDDVHHHLAEVLATGRVVVLPDRAIALEAPTWWEIDPVSGTTLGFGPDRRGQFVEAILVLMGAIDNATSAVGMVQSLWACLFNHASAPGMQCCIRNTALKEAVKRYISAGVADYAKLAGLTFVAGQGAANMLNNMLIGKMSGKVAGGLTSPMDPSRGCPQ